MSDTNNSILSKEEIIDETEESVDSFNRLASECVLQDVKQASSLAEKAYAIAQKLFYRKGIAESASMVAQCCQRVSNYAQALEKALEAMEIFRSTGDKKGESDCLNTIGSVYNYLGDHESRLACNLRTLQLRQEAGDKNGEIGSLNNIGDTHIKLGNFSKALDYFNQCLAIEHISERHKTIVLHNIGETYFYMKHYVEAEPYFRKGIELSHKTNYKGITCVGHIFLAEIKIQDGAYDEAMGYLKTAMDIAMEINARDDMVAIYKNMAEIFEKKNNLNEAFRYFKLYHETKEDNYNETKIREIKNLQFQYQLKELREETQTERDKNLQLQKAFEQIEIQKNEIAQKNLALTDSIGYAKRLQESIFPIDTIRKELFPQSFVLFKPKDIVSGDFYWYTQKNGRKLIAVVDCTGHGVPAALLSMLGNVFLDEIVNEQGITQPSEVLSALRFKMIHLFRQKGTVGETQDGMDIALLSFDEKNCFVEFAGANSPLRIVRKHPPLAETAVGSDAIKLPAATAPDIYRNVLIKVPPTKRHIGYFMGKGLPFENQKIPFQKGDTFYIVSDGFADQFGGHKGKKFRSMQLEEKLLAISPLSMEEQKNKLEQTFNEWKGDLYQVDDVLVMGVRM